MFWPPEPLARRGRDRVEAGRSVLPREAVSCETKKADLRRRVNLNPDVTFSDTGLTSYAEARDPGALSRASSVQSASAGASGPYARLCSWPSGREVEAGREVARGEVPRLSGLSAEGAQADPPRFLRFGQPAGCAHPARRPVRASNTIAPPGSPCDQSPGCAPPPRTGFQTRRTRRIRIPNTEFAPCEPSDSPPFLGLEWKRTN
jgi:hypothetical protein